jgi:hypothetical protein
MGKGTVEMQWIQQVPKPVFHAHLHFHLSLTGYLLIGMSG